MYIDHGNDVLMNNLDTSEISCDNRRCSRLYWPFSVVGSECKNAMRSMLHTCDLYATQKNVIFNANKSKCICCHPIGMSKLSDWFRCTPICAIRLFIVLFDCVSDARATEFVLFSCSSCTSVYMTVKTVNKISSALKIACLCGPLVLSPDISCWRLILILMQIRFDCPVASPQFLVWEIEGGLL